jgi:AcrR family transcriptional regulator
VTCLPIAADLLTCIEYKPGCPDRQGKEKTDMLDAIPPANSETTKKAKPRPTLSREDWLNAAITVLEKHGIANVKIDRLSKQLKVTRGSFYFHFQGLKDLLASMVDEWRIRNCLPFQQLADQEVENGQVFFDTVVSIWVRENPFSPKLDLAIRDWSRSAPALAREVSAIDDLRIGLLTRAFSTMGYSEDESVVRARITYFHQIGYYALSFKEKLEDRLRYQPLYGEVLVGPKAR